MRFSLEIRCDASSPENMQRAREAMADPQKMAELKEFFNYKFNEPIAYKLVMGRYKPYFISQLLLFKGGAKP